MDGSSVVNPIPAQAGIGLRLPHQAQLLSSRPRASPGLRSIPRTTWPTNSALAELELIGANYPLSLHAVGLSLGSAEGVDRAHLDRLRRLVQRLKPGLVSDHLSWSVSRGSYLPDLLPLPYTEEALRAVCRNVAQVQETLGRQILLENPSTYLQFSASAIPEAEFLAAVARTTGCGVLFDVNNVYVSACNQRIEASRGAHRLVSRARRRNGRRAAPRRARAVASASGEELRIDDHGDHVCAEVWSLYEQALAHFGPRPTLIEWDTRLPALERAAIRSRARAGTPR